MYDVALAVGMEKIYQQDKSRMFAAFSAGVDVELLQQIIAALQADLKKKEAEGAPGGEGGGAGKSRSMFMDIYAAGARAHMKRYGTTKEQFAKVAARSAEGQAEFFNSKLMRCRLLLAQLRGSQL